MLGQIDRRKPEEIIMTKPSARPILKLKFPSSTPKKSTKEPIPESPSTTSTSKETK